MRCLVVAYDPRWPEQFEAERARLTAALPSGLIADVEHVGSTSIPGLSAKPILDMIASVGDLAGADLAEPVLGGLGYTRHRHRLDAALFVKGQGDQDTHHLHLTVAGSSLWRERLAFRDALRVDRSLAEEYSALKAQLLRTAGGEPYEAESKRGFVRRVLAARGVELRDDLHASPR